MQFKDYYQILNISQDASAEDIKKTFRQLAMQYHPDRNPEDTRESGEKFKEINEAYEVLGDEQKRWQYDRLANLYDYPGKTTYEEDSILEMLRRMAGTNFIVRRPGWAKPWGCGRRGGGQCRRQNWREC